MQLRFEGCQPWIRLYNNHLFSQSSASTDHRVATDPAAAFLSGMLDRWWNAVPVLVLHPDASAALDRIWPHFQSAVASHPPVRADVPASMPATYAAHQVSLCYQAADRHAPPTPAECEIRIHQHRMWSITWHHIIPEFLKLLRHPDSEPTRRDIERFRLAAHDAVTTPQNPHHTPSRTRPGKGHGVFAIGKPTVYTRARARHSELIESCGDVLLRFLTAETRPKSTRYHRSGQRLDLRVAMQFEADPRLHDRLWHRTSLPLHPDPAFVVAVDASGSMRGEKATATFEGLVILRETCLRLGIPLAIVAFHAEACVLQTIDHPHQPSIESRLAGLLDPTGGTNLSPALDLASRILTICPHRHRHLWILSDGDTCDPDQARSLLRSIRADGTRIHGLGLGDDSGEIATLIPGSPTHLQPRDLPATFSRLLQGTVVHRSS